MVVSVSESEAKVNVPETCERCLSGRRTGKIIQPELRHKTSAGEQRSRARTRSLPHTHAHTHTQIRTILMEYEYPPPLEYNVYLKGHTDAFSCAMT